MRRRELVALLGGTLASWPLAARAQQGGRVHRAGVLLPAPPSDSEYPTLLKAFVQGLQDLGWIDGRNLKVDVRWAGAGVEAVHKEAAELAALAPDVILAAGSASTGPLLQVTRTIPVVFTVVPDPVAAGFVQNLARPGGNATGFASFEYGIGGKWLELLREVASGVTRVGVVRDPAITAGAGQWSAIQDASPTFGLEVSPINLHDVPDLERAVAAFARSGSGRLIVTSSGLAVRFRDVIVRLAAEHKLPALYYAKAFVTVGGLMSYGADRTDQFRRAATYVHRVLNGEKPADLPVQAPSKYELVVNVRTAKALGLEVSPFLLARADEVIE